MMCFCLKLVFPFVLLFTCLQSFCNCFIVSNDEEKISELIEKSLLEYFTESKSSVGQTGFNIKNIEIQKTIIAKNLKINSLPSFTSSKSAFIFAKADMQKEGVFKSNEKLALAPYGVVSEKKTSNYLIIKHMDDGNLPVMTIDLKNYGLKDYKSNQTIFKNRIRPILWQQEANILDDARISDVSKWNLSTEFLVFDIHLIQKGQDRSEIRVWIQSTLTYSPKQRMSSKRIVDVFAYLTFPDYSH